MRDLLEKGISEYREKGALSLARGSVEHVLRARVWDAEDLSDSIHEIHPRAERDFHYDGLWDEPYAKHVRRVVGQGTIEERKAFFFDDVTVVPERTHSVVYGKRIPFSPIDTYPELNRTPPIDWSRYLGTTVGSRGAADSDLAFLLSEKHAIDYSHWHTEVLSQLSVIDALGLGEDDLDVVFIWGGQENKMASWQRESLDLLGFDLDFTRADGPLTVSRLIVPTYNTLAGYVNTYPSPEDLKWVRERATGHIDDEDPTDESRIYVSRQQSGRRKVYNLDEVEDVIGEYGFRVIHPEELTFREQVEMFSTSDTIVGPHGGGLMNLIFASDATVIELLADEESCQHQFILSNLVDVGYDYLLCEPVDGSHEKEKHKDLIVDASKLRRLLEHYLNL